MGRLAASWRRGVWLLGVFALIPARAATQGNSTCLALEWGTKDTVQCTTACDKTCQVGCGNITAIFTNGVYEGAVAAAVGCKSLADCPANASAAVDVLGSLFANISASEYARASTPNHTFPGPWKELGIENVTTIDVTGNIKDPLLNWGVSSASSSSNPLDPLGLISSLAGSGSSQQSSDTVNIDAQGSVLVSPTDIIVVSRGSENQTADWVDTNANAARVKVDSLGGQGTVHRGFITYAMALEPNITKVLQAANDRAAASNTTVNVIFTGHSLGGASSVLLAMFYNNYYIKSGKWKNIDLAGVYTHGAPMVGDSDFAAAYNTALGNKTFRFVNRDTNMTSLDQRFDDAVTLVPPTLAGFRQVGRYWAVYCDGNGTVYNNSRSCYTKEVDPSSLTYTVSVPSVDTVLARHNISRYADDTSRAVQIGPGVGTKDLCVYTATIRCSIVGANSTECASEKAAHAVAPLGTSASATGGAGGSNGNTTSSGTGATGGSGNSTKPTNAALQATPMLVTVWLLALGAFLL